MTRIIKIGIWYCVPRIADMSYVQCAAGIPTSLEDGALFYAATKPLLQKAPSMEKPAPCLTGALTFVPLLSIV